MGLYGSYVFLISIFQPIQGRSLAQIRMGGGGSAVPPEQVPGGNSSVNFGDN